MGYSTDFTGVLFFNSELTARQIVKLRHILGQDCREHPEWGTKDLYRIDLELNEDLTGLKWDGSEKTYYMEKVVNVLTQEMRKVFPEFGFKPGSKLLAQGEDIEDRWELVVGENGLAERREISETCEIIECPHCKKKINLAKKKKLGGIHCRKKV